LRSRGYLLRFLTNIDSKTPARIAESLSACGLRVNVEEVVTPVTALTGLLESRAAARRVFLLVSAEIRRYLVEEGFGDRFARGEDGADLVVVGDARDSLRYETLNAAFRCVMGGAELVALQRQGFFMGRDGYYLDTGAFVTALEHASGREALLLGKPAPDLYRLALGRLGLAAAEAVVIGDDVAIDVTGAKGVGAAAVLVRTGKFSEQALAEAAAKPDAVLGSLAELPEWLAFD
jgi:inorganic pyrophosphatase